MIINIEVSENGVMKVLDQELVGKTLSLSIPNPSNKRQIKKTDWEGLMKVLEKADKMDFPRRSHEEILRDLHEIRG